MMTRIHGDARVHETPLESARHALMPHPFDPQGFDVVTRIDAFERQVYVRAWEWGFVCGAVVASLVAAAGVLGWATWAA